VTQDFGFLEYTSKLLKVSANISVAILRITDLWGEGWQFSPDLAYSPYHVVVKNSSIRLSLNTESSNIFSSSLFISHVVTTPNRQHGPENLAPVFVSNCM
jgi:hypothetical protein